MTKAEIVSRKERWFSIPGGFQCQHCLAKSFEYDCGVCNNVYVIPIPWTELK